MAILNPVLPQDVDTAETHIDYFFDHLIACLNQRRTALLGKAADTRHEMAARPAARAREERELIEARNEVESGLLMNDLHETQLEIIGKLNEKLAEVRRPLPDTYLLFRGRSEQLEKLILEVGDVLEEQVVTVPRYEDMRLITAVGNRGQEPGQLSNPRGVAIDMNSNHIYVTEQQPARVSIFSESGEFLNCFSHEHMKQPFGIAIHRSNVYISDTGVHGIFHFKIETDMRLDARLIGKGVTGGKFNNPKQLTVSPDGDLYVADHYNHRIQILDESLHYQRSIKHATIQYPCDVKLTANELFVLTTISPCVTVFSHAGENLRSFITCAVGLQVRRPCFFTLDAHGNILISDDSANLVKIFSPNGILLYSLGGFPGGFSSPQGLALTKQLKLVVISPDEPFRIKIFSS